MWRARTLDVWRRAGVTDGSIVIDAGAGPDHATLDLAEIVGPAGKVHALDRSDNFRAAIEAGATARGLANIERHNVDLMLDDIPVSGVDAVFIRWVFIFIPDPIAVLKKLARALKPGGKFICHDYYNWRLYNSQLYGHISLLPPSQSSYIKLDPSKNLSDFRAICDSLWG